MLIELEELKHKINNSKYYGTDVWLDILDMANDCESKGVEWIPCSERLPEVGEPVLTFDGHCICVERRIEWIDTPEGQLDGEWWIDGYDGDECNPINLRDGTAIAWMPLPEPYKEGADDKQTDCQWK